MSLPSVSTQLGAIPASASAVSQAMERTAPVSISLTFKDIGRTIGCCSPMSGLSSEFLVAPFGGHFPDTLPFWINL